MSIHVIFVNQSRVPAIFTFFHFSSFFTVVCDSLPSTDHTNASVVLPDRHLFLTEKTFSVLVSMYPRIKVSMPWIRVAWRGVKLVHFVVTHGCYHVTDVSICGSWSLRIWSMLLWSCHLCEHRSFVSALRSTVVEVCAQCVGLWNGPDLKGCFDCVLSTWGFRSLMTEEIFNSIMEMKRVECI